MNEAAILAARRDLKEISKDEISDALERIIAGPEKKNAVVSEEKKKLVAYHGKFYVITVYCNLNSSWGPWIANRLFEF
jgi:ATP-dependent Zn protease